MEKVDLVLEHLVVRGYRLFQTVHRGPAGPHLRHPLVTVQQQLVPAVNAVPLKVRFVTVEPYVL